MSCLTTDVCFPCVIAEASKVIMQYVAEVSGKGQDIDRVKEQLLQSNPVLEGWHLLYAASYFHPTQTSFTRCLLLSPNTNIIFHTLPVHPTQTSYFRHCLLLSPNANIKHLSDIASYCHPTQTSSFTHCLLVLLSPNTNIIFHTLPLSLTVTQHKHHLSHTAS